MTEREAHITSCVKEHFDEACSLGHEIFCVVLQGSQNYNLDLYTPDYRSDVDTKAIVLPSFNDFVRGKQPISTTHVRQNDEHIDLKDIRVMFDTFKKQNVNFVEILFSPYYIVSPKYKDLFEALRNVGERLTHCNPCQTVRTMAGMSCEKLKALCHPYPTIIDKIDKYGYDGKQLHHIIRINAFLKNYISGMSFASCLTTHTAEDFKMAMDAKLNVYPLAVAKEMAERIHHETLEIKNAFEKKHGDDPIDQAPYTILEDIKTEAITRRFKEQLQ